MPGVREAQRSGVRVEHGVRRRRHRARLRALHVAVDKLERAAGPVTLLGVGAQRRSHLAHQRRRPDAVADDISDGQAEQPARQLDDVVPVSAHLVTRGEIARRHRHARDFRQLPRQQAALEQDRDLVLTLKLRDEPGPLDRGCGPRGRELEHGDVFLPERARRDRADVKHADEITFDDQGDPEQGPDPLLTQDRVVDVRVIDVRDEDRDALGSDAAGEAPADRNPHPLLDLLLDAARCAGHELLRARVVEQDRDRVDGKRVADAREQGVKQPLKTELGERGVAEPVEVADLLGRRDDRPGRSQHDLAVPRLRHVHVELRGSGRHHHQVFPLRPEKQILVTASSNDRRVRTRAR